MYVDILMMRSDKIDRFYGEKFLDKKKINEAGHEVKVDFIGS